MITEVHTQKKIPLSGGFEMDFLTGWSKVLRHNAGTRKAAKTKYQRRMRRVVRVSLDQERQRRECHLDECWICTVTDCPDMRLPEDAFYFWSSEQENWDEWRNEEGRDG